MEVVMMIGPDGVAGPDPEATAGTLTSTSTSVDDESTGSVDDGAPVNDGETQGLVPSAALDTASASLLAALDTADDLPLDERLALLRDAEVSIAGALEGLDGL